MKYALVNGSRAEAQPGLSGQCPSCSSSLTAKCGEINVWHWAHTGKRMCDVWWEPETEWHRAWKENFPVEWQEVIHTALDGEKHIADVKTDQGWAIEFQHSFLNPEERRSRDGFYQKLVWVVDGTRRKRDQIQFFKALNDGGRVSDKPILRKVFSDECALLKEWESSQAPIFFDFGEQARIWWLLPRGPNGSRSYIAEFPRLQFVALHRSGETQGLQEFEKFLADFSNLVLQRESQLQAQAMRQNQRLVQRPQRHFRF